MTYDVSGFQEFNQAYSITDYRRLIGFFSKFDESFYATHDVYTERHHIYPKFETREELPFVVKLPLFYHFRAHILRARESTGKTRSLNYSSAFLVVYGPSRKYEKKDVEFLFEKFPDEIYEAKAVHVAAASVLITEWNKSLAGKTYDEIFGKERADEVKAKISQMATIKNLNESEETREKRRTSIQEYVSTRPPSHNAAISRAKTGKPSGKKTKRVIHLNTMTVYDSARVAAEAVGQRYGSVLHLCTCPEEQAQCHGHYWSYYEDGVDYEEVFRSKKARHDVRPRGWSLNDQESREKKKESVKRAQKNFLESRLFKLRDRLLKAGAKEGPYLDEYVALYDTVLGTERHRLWPFYGNKDEHYHVAYLTFEGHVRAHELVFSLFDGELLVDAARSLKSFLNKNASRLDEATFARLREMCSGVKAKYPEVDRRGTVHVTDGVSNRVIDGSLPLPSGWRYGRTKDARKAKRYAIYDVSFIENFYEAEKIDDYESLVTFFSKYDREFYESRSIYAEEHHVVPTFEGDDPRVVLLPVYFNFRAHLLRARESVDPLVADMNYGAAFACTLQPNVPVVVRELLFKYFADDVAEARIGWERVPVVGRDKRVMVLRKRSTPDVCFLKSDRSKRRVIDLLSGDVYAGVREAAAKTGCPAKTVSACCEGSFFKCMGYVWRYYEDGVDPAKFLRDDLEKWAREHPRTYRYVTVRDLEAERAARTNLER